MRLRLLPLIALICCLAAGATCIAQSGDGKAPAAPWSGFGIEVNPLVGKVFKHEAKFSLPIPALTTGLDVNFILRTYGKRRWEQWRHFPTIGIGATYTNYGLDNVYGRCFGIYPNLTIPLISGRRLEWTLKLGDGIGYVTRHFTRAAPIDTVNAAIGSHINDFANFSTDLRYRITKHWDVQIGAHFTHISDASFDKPNLGVNMYGGHLGVRYYPVTSRPARVINDAPKLSDRWLFQGRLGMSYVSSQAPNGPLYPVYLATGYVSRRWKNVNKMFAGFDYSYHSDIYAFLRLNEIDPGQEAKHSYKSAFIFGNEFLMGRVGIILQVGVYIKEAELKQDPYYEKVGGHYYIIQKEKGPLKELFFEAFLKTHKTIAELGEFGLGFGF